MELKRLLLLITPLSAWFLCQACLVWPSFFYAALALGALAIIVSVWVIAGRIMSHDWLPFAIAPLFFFLSFVGYAAIIYNRFWVQTIFALIVWFLFFYLKHWYYYITYGAATRAAKLDNLMVASGTLSIFAFGAVFFGLPAFIDFPLAARVAVFALVAYLMFWQFVPVNRGAAHVRPGLAVGALVLAELAGLMSFLPLLSNVLAVFIAIAYYLVLAASRLYWQGSLDKRRFKWPLILGSLTVLVLLLTARWL